MTALTGFFESYYRLRPVNATFTGVHDHDHRLPDWSPDGLASAVDDMRRLRRALESARGSRPLEEVAARDGELAITFLDVQIAEHEGLHFQRGNPSLAIGEVAFGVISLMTRPFAGVEARAAAAVSRLDAVPTFLAGACAAIAQGVPDPWRAKCLRECEGVDLLFRDGIARWIEVESIPAPLARDLTRAAQHACAGVDTFRGWFRNAAPASPARTAAGPDMFDLLLIRGHWCERPRRDLAADASAALYEALARLDERAREVAPGGWPDVQRRLTDAHPAPGEYLATYQRIWDACQIGRAHV